MEPSNPPLSAAYSLSFSQDLDVHDNAGLYADFNSPAAPSSPSNRPDHTVSLPPTPYTPSFAANAGSFNNSPLGSDISFTPGNDFSSPNPAGPFSGDHYDDFIDIDVFQPDYTVEEYDPTAYDAPDNSTLLFSRDFMTSITDQQQQQQQHSSSPSLSASSLGSNNPGVSVSVTPAHDSLDSGMGSGAYGSPYDHGSPYDQGSPASSNGDGDYQNPRQQQIQQQLYSRSRASSVSSLHGANDFASTTLGMEHVRIESSWANKGPQSPPQLFIPSGVTPEITHTTTSPHPSPTHSTHSLSADASAISISNLNAGVLPPGSIGHNGLGLASGGKGLMAPNGPGIHIVPATPISAGTGAGAAQGGPFHQCLETLRQGQASSTAMSSLSGAQSQSWTQPSQFMQRHQQHQQQMNQHRNASPLPRLPQAPPSPYTFPPSLTPPPSGGNLRADRSGSSPHLLGLGDGSRGGSPDNNNNNGNGNEDNNYLVAIQQNPRTRSKSDTSVRPPMWQIGSAGFGMGQGQNQAQAQASTLMEDVFVNDAGQYERQQQQQQQQQLPRLNTPHNSASYGPPATGSPRPSGFNVSINNGGTSRNNSFLSPDYGLGSVGGVDLRRVRSESMGHRRNALSADMKPIYADQSSASFPPSAHQAFLSRNSAFLSPGQPGGGFGGGMAMISAGGAHRRSLSGGSGHGHSRSLSRERVSLSASPYPSPHASPRMNANELLPEEYSFPSAAGSGPIPVHVMGVDAQGRPTVQSQAPMQVVRQNVTTHATADASQRRRRTEANFQCPVPGCGSTFTRHFNLKGHLRSHNEERPFKCKWPGCDKGFARQHDCKRHEQLHLNIRPYNCQGCQRTFARMDALNRHLRSDAGTECQAHQPLLTTDAPNNPDAIAAATSAAEAAQNGLLTLKTEPDVSWQTPPAGAGVMV